MVNTPHTRTPAEPEPPKHEPPKPEAKPGAPKDAPPTSTLNPLRDHVQGEPEGDEKKAG